MLTLGGGVEYHVEPKWALGLGARWTGRQFSTMKLDDVRIEGRKLDATSVRLTLDQTWRPMLPK